MAYVLTDKNTGEYLKRNGPMSEAAFSPVGNIEDATPFASMFATLNGYWNALYCDDIEAGIEFYNGRPKGKESDNE